MLLNCDLGESFGAWKMGLDVDVMPHIDMANIACGFHAGDPSVMAQTLALAKEHSVSIGAHPSYPDLQGFGRRSLNMAKQDLIHCIHYQVAALEGMANIAGMQLTYVKPHGALYNDMMRDASILETLLEALSIYPSNLKLMLLATAQAEQHKNLADQYKVDILLEAFADRLYTDDGLLTPRAQPNAVHNEEKLLEQVDLLATKQSVLTATGKTLFLPADTLCVHGDNLHAINQIQKIKNILNAHT
ncbi:5-oxoprolinase subunit PxpA [Pseudoalteromonas obscura]|uniref:5-oxoprolinase subunit PxpA n=1 Tax=Pseudoalteromonas obscura TaxID=3048491 RepID=A0ABT7EM75_9GAMM|nr:5-oxoprolinase subunit PxpA [Pseudoalteromonas sp. P94(2023)]MDK2596123.1 5-oxoprolinase subunit PxpA [Pseudoalteromonas sp. P94(2023)]